MLRRISEFKGFEITINTTEECNMRCKYCYEINKANKNLKFEEIKKFLDLFIIKEPQKVIELQNNELSNANKFGVLIDFIGGDSFMNVDLMEQTIKYFIYLVNTVDNKVTRVWRKNYRFSISTNGTLFNDKVKKFCEKYKDILYVGISIDGCPEIHDKNRIMSYRGPNGEEIGSMQFILKDWEWYKTLNKNMALTTKATMSKDTIPYIYESLKYMHEKLGLVDINQNFIMEDAHLTKEDYIEFDNQLRKSVEYILKNKNKLYWSVLDKEQFAKHYSSFKKDLASKSHCGSGDMPCLGVNGKIYPCFRWAPHTQTKDTMDKMVTGDIENGFNNFQNFFKVLENSEKKNCTKEERCKECEYESACAYCIGGCYSEFGDFIRTTYICEITKLQCKWAKVYWNEYNLSIGEELEFDKKYLLKNVPSWNEKYLGTNLGD